MDSFTRDFNAIKAEINSINQQQSKLNVMRPTLFIRRGSLIQRMQELAAEATFIAAAAEQDALLAIKMHKNDHIKYAKLLDRCSDVDSRWIEHQVMPRADALSTIYDTTVADFPQHLPEAEPVAVGERPMSGQGSNAVGSVGTVGAFSNSNSIRPPTLEAIVTTSWPSIPDSRLYYVTDAGAFAFWAGPELFYGNIGRVFENTERPWHFKSCHFGPACTKSVCLYYHDPKICGGANVRNYLNNIGRMMNQYGMSSDRIGTKKIDIEDLAYLKDFITHLLLCYFVLKKGREEIS